MAERKGYVLVSRRPTADMICETLPNMDHAVSEEDRRLAESGLFLLEPEDLPEEALSRLSSLKGKEK